MGFKKKIKKVFKKKLFKEFIVENKRSNVSHKTSSSVFMIKQKTCHFEVEMFKLKIMLIFFFSVVYLKCTFLI